MKQIDRRIGLLFACFILVSCATVVRAAWIQGVNGASYRAEAQSQHAESVTVPGVRGAILDRNGNELAVSEDAVSVFATPYQVRNPPRAAAKLAQVLQLDQHAVLEQLSDEKSGFTYLARKVGLPTAEKVEALDLEGIGFLPDSRRIYPEGEMASQVIGTVGIDNQGLTGLEASQDEILHGSDGEREIVRDALGEELERNTLEAAEVGANVKLTIDGSIQAAAERVVSDIGERFEPEGATAIVLDPRNAQVLAMANWPGVDPYRLDTAKPEDLQNMATSFTYEPGSTFKAFTVAAAVEEDVVEPTTTFDLAPTITVADRTIEEAHPRGAVRLSVADIVAQSSNVGAVTVGLELNRQRGDDAFDTWIRRFGFGAPTGIDFPGEEQGIVIPPEEYSGSSMGNLPIGQGLAVTPIQMASAYAAIANGGVLHTPRLILEHDGERVRPTRGTRVMSKANSRKLREMLEGVLEEGGTASSVQVPGYVLAGKTGTAQKVVDGTYSETEYVGSFVGFAPAHNPRLLVSVVVDSPPYGSHYGGSVAAPAFGEIAKFALPYLGVPPDDPNAVAP